MSFQHVDVALRHFSEFKYLLEVDDSRDIDECLLTASNHGRLCFSDAILDVIASRDSAIPDEVVLGGLRAIVDPAATMLPYSLFAEDVSADLRTSVLSRLQAISSDVFVSRCSRVLAHGGAAGLSDWNLLCFMWWAVLPRHGVPDAAYLRNVDHGLLEAMGRMLELEHVACKESALRGLALWRAAYADEVQTLIDGRAKAIPDVLQHYASAARRGEVF